MGKCLLIVGGGIEAIPGVKEAKAMGHQVVVSDINPEAPCFDVADHRLIASTYDADATVEAALDFSKRTCPIDGVMSVGTDVPVTVSRVAAALHVHGLPVEAAELAQDKLAMKSCLRAAGLPVPWSVPIPSLNALEDILATSENPFVIKPVDSRGARGVMRIRRGDDAGAMYLEAKRQSPTGRVMLERYLSGPQVSTESILLSGKAYTPGFSDRNYSRLEQYAPYFIEDGGDLPSRLEPALQQAVRKTVEQAALSLGIDNWVAKGDIVIHEGVPHVIEMAARLSGGYFCTHEIPLSTGVDIVAAVIRLALGDPVDPDDLREKLSRSVSQRYLFPNPGIVTNIEGIEQVERTEGVALCEVRVDIGDEIREIDCHPARAGVVIAAGDSSEAAARLAASCVDTIRITTSPTALSTDLFDHGISDFLSADTFTTLQRFTPKSRPSYQKYVQTVYNLKLATLAPSTVHIEPTNACNQSCIMCLHPDMKRPARTIDEQTAIRAIEECGRIGVYAVHFFYFGEPFLNERTIDYMAMAKRRGIPVVSTTSNFAAVRPRDIQKLVDDQIDSVHISFEGLSRERYHHIRGKDHHKVVVENLASLQRYKEQRGSTKPWIALTYVRTTERDDEIERFRNSWRSRVDDIHISPQFYYFGRSKIAKEEARINSEGIMRRAEEFRVPCRQLWLRLALLSNGDLVPCSQNMDGELSIGNFESVSIREAWQSPRLAALRAQHIDNRIDPSCICRDCVDWDWSGKVDHRPRVEPPEPGEIRDDD